jgi:hypothetical protein
MHEKKFMKNEVVSDVIWGGLKNMGSKEQQEKENTKKRVFP